MTNRLFPPILVVLLIISFLFGSWILFPFQAVVIFAVATGAGFIGWLLTTYRNPVESRGVISLFLIAVAIQLIHMGEEVFARFPDNFTDLVNATNQYTEREFLAVSVFGMTSLLIFAAVAMSRKIPIITPIANYFAWFYALGLGLTNAIAHFVMPILAGGYFPGLITAPVHLIMSVILIRALLIENKAVRERRLRGAGGSRGVTPDHIPETAVVS